VTSADRALQPNEPPAGGLDALGPIGRETVQDRIYRKLRDGLISGAFDAGEVFLAADVAKRMSVSSMPVREALARLVSERALETLPSRRARVPLLTHARARDISDARALIEGELAARAVKNLSKSDILRLEELTDAYEAAEDAHRVAQLNHAFHFTLYGLARSSVLLPFVESLWMQAGPYVRAAARLHSPLKDASAKLHHRGILTAIVAGDAAKASSELKSDISQSFAILERAGDEIWDKNSEESA